MENVTKALLIAAGILLAIMILSLIVVFWGQISGYYTEQHNSKIAVQNADFNAKFENYNQQTIRGNELISIMNKVVNYNTSIVGIEGDYDRVIMSVNFKGYQNDANNNFKYDSSDRSIFVGILNGNILINQGSDENLEKITNLPSGFTQNTGFTDTQLQRLAAEISNIAIDKQLQANNLTDKEKEALKKKRNDKLENILGESKAEELSKSSLEMNDLITLTKRYYQYMQFKRAMFRCTEVQHNTTGNGRVNRITFEIVEENGKAKFN